MNIEAQRRIMGGDETTLHDQRSSRPGLVLQVVVAIAFFMESIDGSMISTALPVIAASLHVAPVQLKLAYASYFLAMATFIPMSGWCADRFGARVVFCASIAVFTLSSVACAGATNLTSFVIARGVQGMAGAMMFPVGRMILVRSMPKSEFVRAFANVTIPSTIGALSGPMLGGGVTTYWDWRWLFWINVPIGMLIIVVGLMCVPALKEPSSKFDLWGLVVSGASLCCLGFGITSLGGGHLQGYTALLLIAIGAVGLWVYFRRAAGQTAPVLDLRLLAIDTYRTGIVSGFVIRAAGAGAFSFLLPLTLQVGFGLTPLQSGMLTFASAAGFFATKFVATGVLKQFGFRRVLEVNAWLGGLAIGCLALLLPNTPHAVILVMLFAGGLSRCLQYMALDTLSYSNMPPAATSRASTVASVSKQFSTAVGVAYAAGMLQAVAFLRDVRIGDVENFRWAFLMVALPAGATALLIRRLAKDAGSEVSGHRPAG
ncbi:hypothetical protein WK95_06060 [Burkholderia ubonensis]|nr:hypothetical protein WK95_06060 [Burkholderia ubonensis]